MFAPMSRPSGHWHPEDDRAPHSTCSQRVASRSSHPHPCIQMSHSSDFLHPNKRLTGRPFIRNHVPVIIITQRSSTLYPNVASQRPHARKERPTGHLIHFTSRPSDRRVQHPKITSHRPSAPQPSASTHLVASTQYGN